MAISNDDKIVEDYDGKSMTVKELREVRAKRAKENAKNLTTVEKVKAASDGEVKEPVIEDADGQSMKVSEADKKYGKNKDDIDSNPLAAVLPDQDELLELTLSGKSTKNEFPEQEERVKAAEEEAKKREARQAEAREEVAKTTKKASKD